MQSQVAKYKNKHLQTFHMPTTNQFQKSTVTIRYVSIELAMARSGEKVALRVTAVLQRLIDVESNWVGRVNLDPLLNSRKYLVDYSNGFHDKMTQMALLSTSQNILLWRPTADDVSWDHSSTPGLSDAIPQSHETYKNAYGMMRQRRLWPEGSES